MEQRKSVMIVDDLEDCREIMREVFAILNYDDIYEAEHGGEALALLEAHPNIQIMTLDLTMPLEDQDHKPIPDGEGILKFFDERGKPENLKIIVVTANPDRIAGLKKVYDAISTKPTNMRTFIKQITAMTASDTAP